MIVVKDIQIHMLLFVGNITRNTHHIEGIKK